MTPAGEIMSPSITNTATTTSITTLTYRLPRRGGDDGGGVCMELLVIRVEMKDAVDAGVSLSLPLPQVVIVIGRVSGDPIADNGLVVAQGSN